MKPTRILLLFILAVFSVKNGFAENRWFFGGDKIFIVHDRSMDETSRAKTARVVESLLRKENIRLVFVQGAAGDVSLSTFRIKIPVQRRKETAQIYWQKERLSTAEYLNLIAAYDFKLWGVEEPDLYERTLEITTRLLKRSASFDRLRTEIEGYADPVTAGFLKRLFDGHATAEDLYAVEAHPEKLGIFRTDSPADHALREAVNELVEFQNISSARARFEVLNIRRILKENKKNKAAFFVEDSQLDRLVSEIKDSGISYEIIETVSTDHTDPGRVEKRIFEEAGVAMLESSPADGWKTSFLKQSTPALRPAREALAFDLLRDRKPLLWDLGESLGLSPDQNLRMMFNGLTYSSLRVLKKNASKISFTWARPLFSKNVEPGQDPGERFFRIWQQQTLDLIETDYDRQKYKAFKELVRKTEMIKATPEDTTLSFDRYMTTYEKALSEAERNKEEKKRSFFEIPWFARLAAGIKNFTDGIPSNFEVKPEALQKIVSFLRHNVTPGGLPLSYKVPKDYWATVPSSMDDVDSAMERLLTTHSVSIYDAALWQISLSLLGNAKDSGAVAAHTERLLSGTSGQLSDIRAYNPIFKYGDAKKMMKKENAYFFRIIADEYIQEDPLGHDNIPEFPNFPRLHHEDWKPITGEQAWGVIIGPLQIAAMKYGPNIPYDSPEMTLALSILPAIEAMQAPNGAVYHVPDGTYGKNRHEIANENNCSLYAALRMLAASLKDNHPQETERVEKLIQGQLEYFKQDSFNAEEGVFYQGGIYLNGTFSPAHIFAADCQTWGINALGPDWIDATFGYGTSYRIWKNTKERVGYYNEKEILRGIGFTDGHDIYSVEWTCGAILTTRILAEYYEKINPEWAEELKRDALTMRYGIEQFKRTNPDGSVTYLYSNKRYFIPWGWWANPIPSLASCSWVILTDTRFNPFILGGGKERKARTPN